MPDDGAILKKVISGNMIQMPMSAYYRKVLDCVSCLQVILDPFALPGQIHCMNDDGGIATVDCIYAAAKPHIELIMVFVAAPVIVEQVIIDFDSFYVIYFFIQGRHL